METDNHQTFQTLHGVKALACVSGGKKLSSGRDATDLIGEALHNKARLIMIPVERLDDDFFRLKTRVAGEFVQKFVTYRLRLAIIGDLSVQLAAGSSLRAFVAESNRGDWLWFVANPEELTRHLEVLNSQDS